MNEESLLRHLLAANVIPTGNPWLDDVFAGGLNSSNIVMVAAKTGTGKTHFAIQLAKTAAAKMKRVTYFALEAERYEIERRQLYYAVCGLVRRNYPTLAVPRYREWLHQGFLSEWDAIEQEARRQLELDTAMLDVQYRTEVYTPEQFKRDVIAIGCSDKKPDIIILDHLHHFFLMDGDEIQGLKIAIHAIRRLSMDFEIPIVILAQLRKNDSSLTSKKGIPTLEDLRGTAALTDIATDVILISNVPHGMLGLLPDDFYHPQFFHVAKSRTASEARNYVAACSFDVKEGAYSRRYGLFNNTPFSDPEPSTEKPKWARGGFVQRPQIKPMTEWSKKYD